MRVLATTAATFALVAGMFTAASTSAAPAGDTESARDSPGCVTKGEYKRTHRGMRVYRVHHRLYETNGWFIKRNNKRITRRYGFCKRARHQANARSFAVVYRKGRKMRVRAKFCGPKRTKSRSCF